MNGRLDTLQAAILIEKLAIFDEELELRQQVADRYTAGLKDIAQTPAVTAGATSVWAQYTLWLEHRDAVAAHLKRQGIPTAIYYPKPLHRQTAYRNFPVVTGGLSRSEEAASGVLSLPMHPYLEPATQDRIIAAVRDAAAH
jgi:dTDP-4-amino-4,6-dideoxygalactose transaminase